MYQLLNRVCALFPSWTSTIYSIGGPKTIAHCLFFSLAWRTFSAPLVVHHHSSCQHRWYSPNAFHQHRQGTISLTLGYYYSTHYPTQHFLLLLATVWPQRDYILKSLRTPGLNCQQKYSSCVCVCYFEPYTNLGNLALAQEGKNYKKDIACKTHQNHQQIKKYKQKLLSWNCPGQKVGRFKEHLGCSIYTWASLSGVFFQLFFEHL